MITTAPRTVPHGIGVLLARRGAWVVLVVAIIGLLAIGSNHPPPSSAASRIAYLDSVIKCPACDDISIAQSDIVQARELRAKIASLVDEGKSNNAIEQYVVGLYGSNEILLPPARGLDSALWILPLIAIVLGVGGIATVLLRRRSLTAAVSDEEDEALVAIARGEGPT